MVNQKQRFSINNIKLVIFLIFLVALAGCETREEKDLRISKAHDKCYDESYKASIEACEATCEADPKVAYCGIVYGDKVVGSGCSLTIERMAELEDTETLYKKTKKLTAVCKKLACDENDMDRITATMEHCRTIVY